MAHALHASAFAGAKVAPTRAARSSASTGRKSVVTRAMAAKTLSIPKTFEDLKKRGQCAFIPFICAGDGGIDTTEKAVRILDEAGSDVIELGVPYSDPLADAVSHPPPVDHQIAPYPDRPDSQPPLPLPSVFPSRHHHRR
jgi:hypothetical protein